jgi:thermostable 8-oxoguanine DNA glycosylase
MGGANNMEALKRSERFRAFKKALALKRVLKEQSVSTYLESQIRRFSAARFPAKCSITLAKCLRSREFIRGNRVVLIDRLSHTDDSDDVREALKVRCPAFQLKSASDFMIGVGLSQDVIALDTRVLGILERHFDHNLRKQQVQANRARYVSIELALRTACRTFGCSLGRFDRILFQFGGVNTIKAIADNRNHFSYLLNARI